MLNSVSSTIFVLFILLVFMEDQYFNLKLTKITNNCIALMKIRPNNNNTARFIWAAVYASIYVIFIGLLFFAAIFLYRSTLTFIKSIEFFREILDRKVSVLNGDTDINWKYLLILGISLAVLFYLAKTTRLVVNKNWNTITTLTRDSIYFFSLVFISLILTKTLEFFV